MRGSIPVEMWLTLSTTPRDLKLNRSRELIMKLLPCSHSRAYLILSVRYVPFDRDFIRRAIRASLNIFIRRHPAIGSRIVSGSILFKQNLRWARFEYFIIVCALRCPAL